MNQSNASMTVIGAGSYGTALAITLARNGHQVVLWGHDPNISRPWSTIAATSRSFPMCLFPIRYTWKRLSNRAGGQSYILVVVPSHVFSDVLRQIKPLMRPDARLVWATKGLEAETGRPVAGCRSRSVRRSNPAGGDFRSDVR